jgi:hypothetical protein
MSVDETGRSCASPFCGRPIDSGERAIVASASWTSLMAIAQRAADHRELHGVRKGDRRTEASV